MGAVVFPAPSKRSTNPDTVAPFSPFRSSGSPPCRQHVHHTRRVLRPATSRPWARETRERGGHHEVDVQNPPRSASITGSLENVNVAPSAKDHPYTVEHARSQDAPPDDGRVSPASEPDSSPFEHSIQNEFGALGTVDRDSRSLVFGGTHRRRAPRWRLKSGSTRSVQIPERNLLGERPAPTNEKRPAPTGQDGLAEDVQARTRTRHCS